MSEEKKKGHAREGGSSEDAGLRVIFPVPPHLLKRWQEFTAKEKAEKERELREEEKGKETGEEGADE